MLLYSLFDKKASRYGQVMMAHNDALMTRELREQIPPGHVVAKYPQDFELYRIGAFEDETGKIMPGVEFVCNVSAILQPEAK